MNSKQKLTAAAPYLYARADSSAIMRDVIIALLPCLAAGIYLYGWDVLVNAVICAVCSAAFEAIYEKMLGKAVTAGDLSAVVTGLILYLNLPFTAPVWLGILGCFVAIVIVKQLFGGIGKNFANPALVGILVLRLGFPSYMTQWTVNGKMTAVIVNAAQGQSTGPTALQLFRLNSDLPTDLQMLAGLKNGPVSQACSAAVLLGLAYLLVKRVISPAGCIGFFGTVAVISLFSGLGVVFQLCAGGTLFYGVFMANDYTTSPMTRWGKLIFGILFGVLTMFFRAYSSFEDGISFALLFLNLLVPYIDGVTRPRPYGWKKGGADHD